MEQGQSYLEKTQQPWGLEISSASCTWAADLTTHGGTRWCSLANPWMSQNPWGNTFRALLEGWRIHIMAKSPPGCSLVTKCSRSRSSYESVLMVSWFTYSGKSQCVSRDMMWKMAFHWPCLISTKQSLPHKANLSLTVYILNRVAFAGSEAGSLVLQYLNLFPLKDFGTKPFHSVCGKYWRGWNFSKTLKCLYWISILACFPHSICLAFWALVITNESLKSISYEVHVT